MCSYPTLYLLTCQMSCPYLWIQIESPLDSQCRTRYRPRFLNLPETAGAHKCSRSMGSCRNSKWVKCITITTTMGIFTTEITIMGIATIDSWANLHLHMGMDLLCAHTTSTIITCTPRPWATPTTIMVTSIRPHMLELQNRGSLSIKAKWIATSTMMMISLSSLISNHSRIHIMESRRYKHMLRILSSPTLNIYFKSIRKYSHLLFGPHPLGASMTMVLLPATIKWATIRPIKSQVHLNTNNI